jgi:signal transduction histidine kinase
MAVRGESALKLAELIDGHKQGLSVTWSKKIDQEVGARYSAHQRSVISGLFPSLLENICNALKTGSHVELDRVLDEISREFTRDKIDIHDAFDCIVLCKESISPLIYANPEGDVNQVQGMVEDLDVLFRRMLGYFNQKIASEKSRMVRHLHQHTMSLIKAAQATRSSAILDDVYRDLATNIANAAGENNCNMYVLNPEENRLSFRLGVGRYANPTAQQMKYLDKPIDLEEDPFMKRVLTDLEPLASEDTEHDTRVNHELMVALGIKSVLVVPLEVQERILAMAVIYTTERARPFTEEQIEFAWTTASSGAMEIDNARLFTENSRRLEENQGIQRVITALMREQEIEKILKIVCSEAQILTGAHGSAVFFIQNDDQLKLAFSTGDHPLTDHLPYRGSISEKALQDHKPIIINRPTSLGGIFQPDISPDNLLIAPLSVNERYLGAHYLVNKPGGFTPDDTHLVSIYTDQSAVAIENARLRQKVQYMAVLEERERVAREIHDNLAQALSTIKLQASYIGDLLTRGDTQQARESITELVRITGETNAEARDAIYTLRNNVVSDADFLPRLQSYLAKYQKSYAIDVQLDIQEGTSITLPPQSLLQVMRIIQEALTNVRKHTRADKAYVSLAENEGEFILTVEDNGQGFKLEKSQENESGHVGMQIMRERAESLGGSMEVSTQPGRGTKITVRAPLPARR